MSASTSVSPHLFWVISRGAGTTAMILSSLAVGLGLAMGGRLMKRVRPAGPDRRVVHEMLSLAVMAALAVHALALLGDRFLHPSLLDVTVPFVLSYKTMATSTGIVAAWGLVCLGLAYYARRPIGIERFRAIHRFTALAWLLGLIHTFTEGTDRGQLWFIALIAVTAAPALTLLVVRLFRRPRGAPAPAQATA